MEREQSIPENIVGIKNSQFPERVGRSRPTALEIATTVNAAGKEIVDPVVFLSVSRMDAGE